jgi:hypothetical protein
VTRQRQLQPLWQGSSLWLRERQRRAAAAGCAQLNAMGLLRHKKNPLIVLMLLQMNTRSIERRSSKLGLKRPPT